MFRYRFSTKIVSWSAENVYLQVVLPGRKLFSSMLRTNKVIRPSTLIATYKIIHNYICTQSATVEKRNKTFSLSQSNCSL
jgi:hypothetical protein